MTGTNVIITGAANVITMLLLSPAYNEFMVVVPTTFPDTKLIALPAAFVVVRFGDTA